MDGYIGIDLGTSCVKTVMLSKDGGILSQGSSDLKIQFPKPGYVQQDPKEWWNGTKEAINQLKNQCPQVDIKGVGVSGQMLGSVLLDTEGEVLDDCIIWMDQRASIELKEVKEKMGEANILERTANEPLVSYWVPKLLWIKKHKPELYQKIAKILFPKDYLKYKLTGICDMEVTDAAGTMLFCTAERRWDWELFDCMEIDRGFVSPLVSESSDIIGAITKEASEYLGIPEGIPVVSGGGDQMCGAIGLGITESGKVSVTIGTSGCVFTCSRHCIADRSKHALLSYCYSIPNTWCIYGCTLMAGGAFRWLRDTIFSDLKENAYDIMNEYASRACPGCEGLLFLPYLNGERTPHPDPEARGVFFGLSSRHGRAEICRSVMEGVAYSLRDTVELFRQHGISAEEVCVSGGGAVSPLWRQILADILRARVVTTNVKEAPAVGAAMLAAVGTGGFIDLKEAASRVVKIESLVEPNKKLSVLYDDYYDSYKELYCILQNLYKKQAQYVGKWEGYEPTD